MRIQLVGAGCGACEKMKVNVESAVRQLELSCAVESVTRIVDMIEMGVTQTPALILNGEVKSVGRVLDIETIKSLLRQMVTSEGPK